MHVGQSDFADNLIRSGTRLSLDTTRAIGGGIANANGASLTILSTTFSRNQAIGGAGAPGVLGAIADGGAIANVVGSTLEVGHSTFRDNRVVGGAGDTGQASGAGLGGAILNGGNAPGTEPASASVLYCTFTGN